jgi:hypothetical protein
MRAFAVALLPLCASLLAQSKVEEVRGEVVDADGKPVAGVPVAAFWTASEKDPTWVAGGQPLATSGADGAFAAKVLWPGQPTAYFAYDKAGNRGAIAVLDDATVREAQRLALAPLAAVDVAFDFRECGAAVPLLFCLMAKPAHTYVGQVQTTGAELRLLLPPGEYAVRWFARDAVTVDHSFSVAAGQQSLALALPVASSVIAKHYGKEPPALDVTEARGVEASFTLAGLRGKWVLIDFWGFW